MRINSFCPRLLLQNLLLSQNLSLTSFLSHTGINYYVDSDTYYGSVNCLGQALKKRIVSKQ